MNLLHILIGSYLIIIILIAGYISYQFMSGNWKLSIDFEDREYDCESCEGLPMMLREQAD